MNSADQYRIFAEMLSKHGLFNKGGSGATYNAAESPRKQHAFVPKQGMVELKADFKVVDNKPLSKG